MPEKIFPEAAIILCHGIGEHCFPFGGNKALRPKYAHEVGNIPLVRRIVDECVAAGLKKIVIVTGFRSEAITSLFKERDDRIRLVNVSDYANGDGNALLEALQTLNFEGDALVINGDLLAFSRDYQNLLDAYRKSGNRSALLFDELHPEEDKQSWVALTLNKNSDQVERIAGHTADGKFRLSGMAVLSQEDIEFLKQSKSTDQPMYLFQMLEKMQHPFIAVKSGEPLVHVDRAFDYLEANQVILKREIDLIATAKGAYCYIGGEGDPDPEYIFPGTIITPGARLVFEEGSFIGPYQTKDAHVKFARQSRADVIPIRIRGDVHLKQGARIGLNAIIEGSVVIGTKSYVEDSVVEAYVLVGSGSEIRRNAVVRGWSVCGDRTRFECGADFEGVAGEGTIYMHPGQCWIVTGKECDLGAGNFFGTWRFDSGRCHYRIGGRIIQPKTDSVSNATFIGDRVRTAIGVFFAPGTRVGADSLIGAGYLPSGTMEGGFAYLAKQETTKVRSKLLRKL
ncbi:NTP transferase domain-containing protein [candidate division KSB1 bacterium]|nr:NTP transferase domain-containing protein [candidate division KSB1 bacterium]